jgi:hypothetical protein
MLHSLFLCVDVDEPPEIGSRNNSPAKRPKVTCVRESLSQSILYDSSFHNVLLSLIGIGHRTLERLVWRGYKVGNGVW